jgi:hypothetical protein
MLVAPSSKGMNQNQPWSNQKRVMSSFQFGFNVLIREQPSTQPPPNNGFIPIKPVLNQASSVVTRSPLPLHAAQLGDHLDRPKEVS